MRKGSVMMIPTTPKVSIKGNINALLRLLPQLRQHRNNVEELNQLIGQHELYGLIRNSFTDIDELPRSLTKSYKITHALITFVEQTFEQWRKQNGDSHDHRRRRRIVLGYYNLGFDGKAKDIQTLAEQERITEKRVKQELAYAQNELSSMLFGVNGISKFLMGQGERTPPSGKPTAPTSRASVCEQEGCSNAFDYSVV